MSKFNPGDGIPEERVSCYNCPSMLPSSDTNFFKKSIGVPVCAQFGKPLCSRTHSMEEREQLAEHFAKGCTKFKMDKPLSVNWENARFAVMMPDIDAVTQVRENPDAVNSCGSCKWMVRDNIVSAELGWAANLCTAKGKLILGNRMTLEARNCDMKSYDRVRTDVTGLMYLPEYDPGFFDIIKESEHQAVIAKMRESAIDPQDYETDEPVADHDAAKGVRAWRRVSDEETGNSTLLPIFRTDFFPSDIQELIPKIGDDEHPEDYLDHAGLVYKTAILWRELDETPAFWGQSGTGKTEHFRHMAFLMGLPFYRFSITGSTELDDLFGKMHYTEGQGTHFEKGRMVRAWESPCVMVVDEPNAGPPDVWQALRPMTDNSKQLVLDQSNGETSNRHDDCYLGMAMNPAWDSLNVGTQQIADPDVNRLMHIFVEVPPVEIERDIIIKRCSRDNWEIPKKTLDMMMGIAQDIRSNIEKDALQITWAIRPQLKVARALRWFDPITAYRMASADYLEPEQQAALLDIVKTHSNPNFASRGEVPF